MADLDNTLKYEHHKILECGDCSKTVGVIWFFCTDYEWYHNVGCVMDRPSVNCLDCLQDRLNQDSKWAATRATDNARNNA